MEGKTLKTFNIVAPFYFSNFQALTDVYHHNNENKIETANDEMAGIENFQSCYVNFSK